MARLIRCLDCPTITPRNRTGRCPRCRAAREKARGSRQERGYGAEHDARRRAAAADVERYGFTCWRCGESFPPGTPFDLGHDDEDRTQYRGIECRPCNRATANRTEPNIGTGG